MATAKKPPKRKHPATPPPMEATKGNLQKTEPDSELIREARVPFNLKVPESFLKRLRSYKRKSDFEADQRGERQGKTMTDIVIESVDQFLTREGF